jgi:hypothetical protein
MRPSRETSKVAQIETARFTGCLQDRFSGPPKGLSGATKVSSGYLKETDYGQNFSRSASSRMRGSAEAVTLP